MKIKIEGTERLTRIADVLATKGNSRSIKRRMGKSFKTAAEPIMRDQRKNLLTELPHSGGAAEEIGTESTMTTRVSYAAPSVTITDAWSGHDLKAIDRGILRHPTFAHVNNLGHPVGRRLGEWFTTKVTPYTLTQPFEDHKSTVRAELGKMLDTLAEEIVRES